MLTDVQDKTAVYGGKATQKAYTVEEVFEHIDQRLIEAFGEDFKNRLSQEKTKRNFSRYSYRLSFWTIGKNKFFKR